MCAAENSLTGNHVTDASCFLQMMAARLNWTDLSDHLIMDVGCGNPKVRFSDLIIDRFPKIKKIICVDKKSHLIDYIKCRVPHPKIEHCVADIEVRPTLEEWEGEISKVVSSHCFHQLQDQTRAFQNVYHLLKAGGEAAIVFCLQSGYIGWHSDLVNSSKWNRYYNGNGPAIPLTQFKKLDESYYRTMLEEIGYTVVHCHRDRLCNPYESEEGWRESTYSLSQSSFNIPDNLRDEFKEDLFAAFLRNNGRDKQGHVCQFSYYLTVLLKKPDLTTG